MAELLVQAAAAALPGSDPVQADPAHRLGARLGRRDGQRSAEEAVADLYLSIYVGTKITNYKYWIMYVIWYI